MVDHPRRVGLQTDDKMYGEFDSRCSPCPPPPSRVNKPSDPIKQPKRFAGFTHFAPWRETARPFANQFSPFDPESIPFRTFHLTTPEMHDSLLLLLYDGHNVVGERGRPGWRSQAGSPWRVGKAEKLQKMENSGNEAKKSLKTKDVTFSNVHKKGGFAAQKSSFSALNSQVPTHFGEFEAKLPTSGLGV